ncbi:MAG: hypothetical protein HN389_12830 [Clostridia bacterium]|jgi:trimethylamine---corrinoid protein Co-methyltransferase|nr:hypothetical protein [Clostridia bacterium]
MINGMLKIAEDKDLDTLHEAILTVLQNTGMRFESRSLLASLAERGLEVDFDKRVVRFAPHIVEKQIEAQANRYKMVRSSLWHPFCKQQKKDDISVPDEFSCDYGHGAPSIYDYTAKAVRKPGLQDQVDMIKLGNALDCVKAICAPFILDEFDPRVEPLESAKILLENTGKPGWVGTYSAKQLVYLGELARIAVDGDEERLRTGPPLVVTVMCTTSPLRLDKRSCEVLEEALKHGYPINFSSMPILGSTTPVAPAGTAVVAAAEIIGGITAASLINPDAYYYSASISAQMDMKTTQLNYSTPSATLADALLNQLFRYKYGIVHNIDAAYIECKQPGIQSSTLRMYRQLTLAGTAAVHLPLGMLDNGATFSPTQAMIDCDINYAIYEFYNGVQINENTLALDAINEIAFGEDMIYLEHEHTLNNFRQHMWETDIFDRGYSVSSDPADEDRKLLERADEKWRSLVQNAPIYVLDKHKQREIDRIVQVGKKDILGG